VAQLKTPLNIQAIFSGILNGFSKKFKIQILHGLVLIRIKVSVAGDLSAGQNP
jgi:hypothetical protein